MASSLVDSLSGDYEPEEFEDDYADAVTQLVAAKIEGGDITETPEAKGEETEVVDLLAALQRSVDKAKAAKGGGSDGSAASGDSDASSDSDSASPDDSATKKSASKGAAKKSAAKKTPAKKAAAKKSTAKKTAAKKAS